MRYNYSNYCKTDGNAWGYETDPTKFAYLYLGDMTQHGKGRLHEVPHSSGSDYSGDSVTVANYNFLMKEFADCLGKSVWTYYGHYGTYGIVYDPKLMKENDRKRMREFVHSLEQYPVLDEDEWARVEEQAIQDAWESWVEYDTKRRLEEFFDDGWVITGLENPETLKGFFFHMVEKTNSEWINKTGNSAYIDIELVLQSYDIVHKELLAYLKEK